MQNRSLKIWLVVSLMLNIGIQAAASQTEVANVLELLRAVYKETPSPTSPTKTSYDFGYISIPLELPLSVGCVFANTTTPQIANVSQNNMIVFVTDDTVLTFDNTKFTTVIVPSIIINNQSSIVSLTDIYFSNQQGASNQGRLTTGGGDLIKALQGLNEYSAMALELSQVSSSIHVFGTMIVYPNTTQDFNDFSFSSGKTAVTLASPVTVSCTFAGGQPQTATLAQNNKIIFVTPNTTLKVDPTKYAIIILPSSVSGTTFTAFSITTNNNQSGTLNAAGILEHSLQTLNDYSFMILELWQDTGGIHAYGTKVVYKTS